MIINTFLNHASQIIAKRRNLSLHHKKGSIMCLCTPKLNHVYKSSQFPDYKAELEHILKDIDVYHPLNPDHFWIGIVYEPHVTFHHGFELQHYAEYKSGKVEFIKDVEAILDALDKDDLQMNPGRSQTFRERLEGSEIIARPDYFPPNPALVGEGEYYTVILRAEPTEEMIKFRSALLKVLPHTATFPEWSVHASICTVASVEARDKLIAKLQDSKIVMGKIKYGYNLNR